LEGEFAKANNETRPKILFIARSMFFQPVSTVKYQYAVLSKKINELFYTLGIRNRPELTGVNANIRVIEETNIKAFKNYHLTPFNDKVYLFKAKERLYFVDDFAHLGWTNYAQKGVSVYEVPGDHKTMFLPPNVSVLESCCNLLWTIVKLNSFMEIRQITKDDVALCAETFIDSTISLLGITIGN